MQRRHATGKRDVDFIQPDHARLLGVWTGFGFVINPGIAS
jgi:hypothetical protein